MSRHSTAHYFLEGLLDLGVEYIFANLGTDHVSLIEELARWDREGRISGRAAWWKYSDRICYSNTRFKLSAKMVTYLGIKRNCSYMGLGIPPR
jgi:hypothetical protein